MSPLKDHWLPLHMRGLQVWNGFIVQLTTDVPCHIWLRWTKNPPHIHKKTVRKRGIALFDDLYYCFDEYGDIDQNQPGDTLKHTFHFAYLEPKTDYWFYHWGYIGGNKSKSCSPILPIRHHPDPVILNPSFVEWHEYPPLPGSFEPDDWTNYYYGAATRYWLPDDTDYISPPYACKMSVFGSNRTTGIEQTISPTLWAGATAIVKCSGKASTVHPESRIQLTIDGTGGGLSRDVCPPYPWSPMKVQRNVPDDATYMKINAQVHSPTMHWYHAHFDSLNLSIPEPIPA